MKIEHYSPVVIAKYTAGHGVYCNDCRVWVRWAAKTRPEAIADALAHNEQEHTP